MTIRLFFPSIVMATILLSSFPSFSQIGTWTWVHGSNTTGSLGSYGTKGIAAISNEPPARYEASYWTDLSGNFWIFGGVGLGAASGINGNDLWKYDVKTSIWTWVNGPTASAPNAAGVYGTKGIPSVNNYPCGRGSALCWTDRSGDLWLFGGIGGHDDMWRYHIATNEWTWISGSSSGFGIVNYGIKGVAAPTNNPGLAYEAKAAYTDATNNLWMYSGGSGTVLWKYSIASDQWTWVDGDNTGILPANYGSYQVEASANQPGNRYSYTPWKDNRGNMYLFAGAFPNISSLSNDVWRYRPTTGKWTWVSGSNIAGDPGNYPPVKGSFYNNYFPPSRYENAAPFPVGKASNLFWTFGGFAVSGNKRDCYNDLWLFSTDSFKWAWVSGSNKVNDPGNYGVLGTPSVNNIPSARAGQCMWTDTCGNVWIFGGSSSGASLVNNDLWRYQVSAACKVVSCDSIRLTPTTPLALCAGDTARMKINPDWTIRVRPQQDVHYALRGGSEILFYPKDSVWYTVTATDTALCGPQSDSIRFLITYDGLRQHLKPFTDTILCKGDTAIYISPARLDVWAISPAKYYNLNADYRTYSFFPPQTTAFRFIGIQNGGCNPHDTLSFTIHKSALKAAFTISPKETIISEPVFQLTNTSSGALSYAWYNNGKAISTKKDLSFTAQDTGTYCFTLVATDSLNCQDSIAECGRVINPRAWLPSAFTPNGDGKNDVFRPYLHDVRLSDFSVYNRWGERVFVSYSKDAGWDGTFKGQLCTVGTYFYFIRYRISNGEEKLLKGDVTLVR